MDLNKEKGGTNFQLRAWCDTKAIVEINSILREIDQILIQQTPFKWCVNMNKPIEVCTPLLKGMEDHGNLMICATLNLDEGPLPQHGAHDIGMSWEELLMQRIQDKQSRMIEMNKELSDLAAMVGDERNKRQEPSFFGADVHGEAYDGDVHCDANVGEARKIKDLDAKGLSCAKKQTLSHLGPVHREIGKVKR
ncbi:hypothetical protein V8G54_003546 [Vigna mungo]|uniref:Uncharacterized protein n=1 Tax=Vigna mungo TaxID=3915 RepID=A0AAQ3PC76_VIGMU